jgi:hypothetical protein
MYRATFSSTTDQIRVSRLADSQLEEIPMKERTKMVAVGGVGLLIYAGYACASITLHSHFWTDRTISQDVPWYYLGQAVVDGACATIALPLVIALGILATRILGKQGWLMVHTVLFLLAMPIGGGVAVLLFTQRIWAGPSEASTSITTFDQYLYVTNVGKYVALAVVVVLIILKYRRTKADVGTTSS